MTSITLGPITVSRTYFNDDTLFYEGEVTFAVRGRRVGFEYQHRFEDEPQLQDAISDGLKSLKADLLFLSEEVESFKLPSL
jgi:hypothetical protein